MESGTIIREAQIDDVPFIASKMHSLWKSSHMAQNGLTATRQDFERWIYHKRLYCPKSYVVVCDDGEHCLGVCGGYLFTTASPPFALCVEEWVWWGESRRVLVATFTAIEAWAKHRGAVGSVRAIQEKDHEKLIWRAL